MATGLRLVRFNFPVIFNSALRKTCLNGTVCCGVNRFIFTEASLGLNGYNSSRLQIHQQFANVETSFRQKMNDIIKNENSIVFTEDLKAMLHLVNKTPEDVDLVLQMMDKFNNQNKELRFGTYVFGPVVMRAFYYLDDPDLALKTFLDTKLTYFFDQNMSYTILMTLLYKHEKYSDIRKVYDIIKMRNVDIQRFPRNALIVVIAGCYKENTPESLEYALNNWKELNHRGLRPIRRVITCIAGLALKQDAPEVALEILTGLRSSRYIDIRCLKVMAYCKLDRLIDIIPLLRTSIDETDTRKESYFSDTIEAVEKSIENANDDVKEELTKLLATLKSKELIDNLTLLDHLIHPIDRNLRPKVQETRDNFQSYQHYNNMPDKSRRRRLGLKDLL